MTFHRLCSDYNGRAKTSYSLEQAQVSQAARQATSNALYEACSIIKNRNVADIVAAGADDDVDVVIAGDAIDNLAPSR